MYYYNKEMFKEQDIYDIFVDDDLTDVNNIIYTKNDTINNTHYYLVYSF